MYSPKPPPERISLTLPVINNARNVIFMAAGAAKARALGEVLGEGTGGKGLPARRVSLVDGILQWFIDEELAEQMEREWHESP